LNVNDEPISKFQFFFNNMLEDFDDLEEEVKAKETGKRRKRRGSYVMPSDFSLVNNDESGEERKSDKVRLLVFKSFRRSLTLHTHTHICK